MTAPLPPDVSSLPAAQLSLEFKVFLVSAVSSLHTQESRTLRFWFKEYVPEQEQARYAQEFFKELVSPLDFPRGEWPGSAGLV